MRHAYTQTALSAIYTPTRPGYIEHYCKLLGKEPAENATSDIENHELYQFSQIYRRIFGVSGNSCVSMDYEGDIKVLRLENSSLALHFRPWFYQTCSEFGWYQTTDSEDQPFGTKSPIEFYQRLCRDIFGDVFANLRSEANMRHINTIYGGFKPGVTNVYFTHGALDPWHPMGVLSDLNKHAPSTVIKGTFTVRQAAFSSAHRFGKYSGDFIRFLVVTVGISHCRDLGSINYKSDSAQLINSKVTIRNLVKRWLKY